MQKEIIVQNSTEITKEYGEAMELHQRIMANGEVLSRSLFEICKDLKEMRDRKLYEEFGYSSFEEYSENAVGLKARMAYNYISTYERLGASVLQSNAHLGITKLELLAGMNPQERTERLESGELEGMSVAEIKELVKKSKDQGEQLSLLQAELETAKQEAAEKNQAEPPAPELEKLRQEIAHLNKKLFQKENEIEAAKSKAEASAAEKAKADFKKEAEKIKTEAAKAAKEAEAETAEKQKQKIETLEAALNAATAEKDKLSKKLSLSDTEAAKAQVYLQALQDDFNQLLGLIGKMPTEQAAKFRKAADRVVEEIRKRLN